MRRRSFADSPIEKQGNEIGFSEKNLVFCLIIFGEEKKKNLFDQGFFVGRFGFDRMNFSDEKKLDENKKKQRFFLD